MILNKMKRIHDGSGSEALLEIIIFLPHPLQLQGVLLQQGLLGLRQHRRRPARYT